MNIEDAIINSIRGKYGNVEINFIEINELITKKESTGRKQDMLDAIELEERTRKS